MLKTEILEMIEEQKQVVAKAQEHLQKLYSLAEQSGMRVDKSDGSIKEAIEKQRKEIMDKVEKIRADATAQAQKASSMAGVSGVPTPGRFGNMAELFKNSKPQEEQVAELLKSIKDKNEEKK